METIYSRKIEFQLMIDVKKIECIIDRVQQKNKQKSGVLGYWSYIDKRYLIGYVNISFLKRDRKETLGILREIQGCEDFLFWANSPEGEQFMRENYNKITESLMIQQTKPWLEYEYGVKKNES